VGRSGHDKRVVFAQEMYVDVLLSARDTMGAMEAERMIYIAIAIA
jgi:hypothetical protein